MKIPYFCCIGAELKRYEKDFDFMNQVYLYKVPTDDSIDEVLAEDYFKAISNSVLQDDIVYIYEASAETLHECRFDKQNGHITAVPLASDETLTGAVTSIIHDNLTPNKLLKSDEKGKVAASDFSENDFVKKSGDTMTGDLAFKYSASYPTLYMHQSATTPDRLVLYKGGVSDKTIILDLAQSAILLEKLHTTKINNGHDIAVPVTNSADTFALKSQVDLAANSGSQLYTTGVWYAKMYATTVVPTGAEYDGRKYADFSQTDSGGNPVIKIYTGASGAWTLTETITPPENYNGYITVTSKIWDIAEQAGQQGGQILWSYSSKTFTPYPKIVSFESINITGNSTVVMPATPTDDSIPNKKYVDDAVAGAHYHPELLSHEWDDHERDDMNWVNALTFSWQNRADHQVAYDELASNISGKTLQSETISGTTVQFYLADNGRKICPASQESNVAAIYTATGVAWYYVLDTTNQRFKLPRINPDVAKQGFGMIPVKGNGYALGLTGKSGGNTYDAILGDASVSGTGGFTGTLQTANGYNIGQSNSARSLSGNIGISTDVTKSGIVADVDAQTTIFSGKKYLYFYVGNFTQTALENTAGLNAELFNGKADVNLTNAVANASATAKETIVNWGIPDYSAGVSKSQNTDYTAEFSGRLICCTTSAYGGGGVDYITVDGQVVATSTNSYEGYHNSLMADIAKGSSFRITKNTGETGWTYKFYPFKGVAAS